MMSETIITIKELEMNEETAIRIAKCLKKYEPEIWKVLSEELTQALRIHDVVEQNEKLPCEHNYQPDTTCGVDITCCKKCGDII